MVKTCYYGSETIENWSETNITTSIALLKWQVMLKTDAFDSFCYALLIEKTVEHEGLSCGAKLRESPNLENNIKLEKRKFFMYKEV